jgi:hypothetical protein
MEESECTPSVFAMYGKAGEIEVPVTRMSEMLRMVNLNNGDLVFRPALFRPAPCREASGSWVVAAEVFSAT